VPKYFLIMHLCRKNRRDRANHKLLQFITF